MSAQCESTPLENDAQNELIAPIEASADVETPRATEPPQYSQSLWAMMESDIRAWVSLWKPESADAPLRGSDVIRFVWSFCGLRATLLYRISQSLRKARVPILPGVCWQLNIILHGFDVPAAVEIGPGLYVPHPVAVTVMARRIGANVTLVGSITVGMRDLHEFPLIGDKVFVGAGARILGGIVIGDGASIGANAVVLADVPAGATAVGVPAKIKWPKLTSHEPRANEMSETVL